MDGKHNRSTTHCTLHTTHHTPHAECHTTQTPCYTKHSTRTKCIARTARTVDVSTSSWISRCPKINEQDDLLGGELSGASCWPEDDVDGAHCWFSVTTAAVVTGCSDGDGVSEAESTPTHTNRHTDDASLHDMDKYHHTIPPQPPATGR